MSDLKEHRFTGIYSGMDDWGLTPHCSCGWTIEKHKQYRGGGEEPTTDMLAEYVNHATAALQEQLQAVIDMVKGRE
jgi:hypothetical protein